MEENAKCKMFNAKCKMQNAYRMEHSRTFLLRAFRVSVVQSSYFNANGRVSLCAQSERRRAGMGQ
jgi:hypothetical protein